MRGFTLQRFAKAARTCNALIVSAELPAARQCVRPFTAIPAGHRNSDLREEVCNKGLNRRLDLIMRGDIKLDTTAGPKTLKDLLKGHVSVICGLPDMGKVCEEHVKGYIEKADALKNEGVKKVMVMGVDKASVVHSWLREKYGDASSSIEAVGDDQGAFTRMLGVNINDPDRKQKTQRFSALVDNGIMVKLRIEESCGKVNVSSADTILDNFKTLKALRQEAA